MHSACCNVCGIADNIKLCIVLSTHANQLLQTNSKHMMVNMMMNGILNVSQFVDIGNNGHKEC